MRSEFKLEIREQHWMGPLPNGHYETGPSDSCSHGSIFCEIGGVIVTADEPDYGITQSALHLLRTLEQDRTATSGEERDVPYDSGFLLCHGCGYPISFGCDNFGTDWLVRHDNQEVILSQPLLVATRREKSFDVEVRLSIDEYRRQIIAFAREGRRFYLSDGPRSVENWEVDLHERFWAEFDERLKAAEMAASHS